ncbi:uncharacterized protein LOC101762961 [Setaria italica]|uniref:uncharacterized protein LOC101762961 n=1 Tax=Setaria italica TaxID=4555 RepID=UPI0003513F50|nr:uncharacterized protein LOC101762961 [Setaria italica]
MKEWSFHDPKMVAYCDEVRKLKDKFDELELNHVARRFNEAADELAKAASGRKPVPDGIFVSDQYKPYICYKEPGRVGDVPPAPNSDADSGEVVNAPPVPRSGANPERVGSSPSALDPEADPSDPETLPANKVEARRIARRAKSFAIIDQELYKLYTGIL